MKKIILFMELVIFSAGLLVSNGPTRRAFFYRIQSVL